MKRLFKGSCFSILLFFVCFSYISCASNKLAREQADIDYSNKKYEKLEEYFASENKNKDKIDLLIDEAMVKSIAGNYMESVGLFNEAYRQMEVLTGEMTAGDKILAGLVSEESIKYSGPAYEYSLLDSMSAYNFIRLGDLDSARAMMRRSLNNNKEKFNSLKAAQKEFEAESKAALNSGDTLSALSAFESVGESIPVDQLLNPENLAEGVEGNFEYQLSPFIFYLGSLLFANDNNMSMADDWMKNVAHRLSPNVVKSVVDIPEGMGSLNVVSLADNIVRRQEAVYDIPIFTDFLGVTLNFKLTWPFVPPSNNIVRDVYVKVRKAGCKEVVNKARSIIVEDFDNAVRLDVASKASGAYSRSLIRNITRKSAAYVVAAAAMAVTFQQVSDDDSLLGLLLLQSQALALQAAITAIDAGEHADIRQGAFFPSKARAAGLFLEPGLYDVTIDYVNDGGRVINREVIPNVEVKEGIPSVVASEFINTGNFVISQAGDDYE